MKSNAGACQDMNTLIIFLIMFVLSGRGELLSTREISTELEQLYARRFSGLRYVYESVITLNSQVLMFYCHTTVLSQ